VILTGVVVLLAVAAGTTQATPRAAEALSLDALAQAYRAGDRELAVSELALWSREQIEEETDRLAAAFAKIGAAGTSRPLPAVALLTDGALFDLRKARFPRVRWELQAAARLLRAAPPATPGLVFERRFYLVATLAAHCSGDPGLGFGLATDGLKLDPEDPELLTALGATIETVAALREYEPSPDASRRSARSGGYSTETGLAGSLAGANLDDAVARYRRALERDATLAEARLRLGRVRLLRGRADDALREFDRVALEARLPDQRYLARIFAGRALEALGDLRGAAERYRGATALLPEAQTGQLALGRVLGRLGDAGGSQAALERASTASDVNDPWWDYLSGQPQRISPLMDELRGLVR